MANPLGSVFGFGNFMKRKLRDTVSNPGATLEQAADENRNEWNKNPQERSMGFFNPVALGSVNKFMLRKEIENAVDEIKSLSRRDFMKKSAGIVGGTAAAGIPGAKLLQKFAPEEKEIAAKAVPKEWASVEGGAHRYHSLKDYLDDVRYGADDSTAEIVQNYFHSQGAGFPGGKEITPAMIREGEKQAKQFENNFIRDRLLQDEYLYNQAKQNAKQGLEPAPYELRFDKNGNIVTTEWADVFSPQAKREMKAYKRSIDSWNNAGGGMYKDIGKREWTDSNHLERFLDELQYYNQSSIPHPYMTADPYNTLK